MSRLPASVVTNHCLSDLVELQRGYDLTADERKPGLVPVIGGGGPNGAHESANVSGPGVVVVRSGSGFGNVWWVENDFWAHNTVMFAKSFKGNDKKFAYYVLDWLDFTSFNSGGAQPSLNRNFIYSIPIFLPPLPEQRKIAEILSTWDAAIAAQERLIANARAQKKALMQSLLPIGAHPPKKQLPGFSGDWVRRNFGSFAESEKRRIDPKSLTIATKCVELEHIESETGALLGFCDAREQASLKSVFEPGHILYGKLRPYLRKFHRPDFSGVCSTEIWSIKANEKTCLPDFLYYLIQSPTFEEAVDVSSGSKMPRADWGIVKGTTFQLPGLKEQRAICDLLDVAEAELTHSQQLLTAFREEKSALMQQLLTGKRRVKLEEAA